MSLGLELHLSNLPPSSRGFFLGECLPQLQRICLRWGSWGAAVCPCLLKARLLRLSGRHGSILLFCVAAFILVRVLFLPS